MFFVVVVCVGWGGGGVRGGCVHALTSNVMSTVVGFKNCGLLDLKQIINQLFKKKIYIHFLQM